MEMSELMQSLIKDRDMFFRRGLELSLQMRCQSDEVADISAAFAKAQAEFEPVTKDKQGYGYKYSTLENMLDVIRPILNKYGLSISQFTTENDVLHTRLRHASGQWFESRMKLKDVSGDAKRSYEQAYGTQLTYMRRYHALALLGVQPEGLDTDGAKPR